MATSIYDISKIEYMGVQHPMSIGKIYENGLMGCHDVHSNNTNASMCSTEDPIDGPTPCALTFSRGNDDDMNLTVFSEKVKDLSVSAFDWKEFSKPQEGQLKFNFGSKETTPPVQMNPPQLRGRYIHPSTFCSEKPLNTILDSIREKFKGKQYSLVENAFESIFLITEMSDEGACGLQVNFYVDDSTGKSTNKYVIEAQHFTGCPWAFQTMFVTLQQAIEGTAATEMVVLTSMTPTTMMDSIQVDDGFLDSKKSKDDYKKQSLETLQC
jgi:hypothetical protein